MENEAKTSERMSRLRVHNNGIGYRGVEYRRDRNKYRARIVPDGGRGRWLGSFDTPEEAAAAYDEAAREIYGDKAYLNFPLEGERQGFATTKDVGFCAHGHDLSATGRRNARGGIDCRECQRILAYARYHGLKK